MNVLDVLGLFNFQLLNTLHVGKSLRFNVNVNDNKHIISGEITKNSVNNFHFFVKYYFILFVLYIFYARNYIVVVTKKSFVANFLQAGKTCTHKMVVGWMLDVECGEF